MNQWLLLGVNIISYGGLLFLLSAGFSLIFGLMRVPNVTHGSVFVLCADLSAPLPAHHPHTLLTASYGARSLAGGGPDGLWARRARLLGGLPPGVAFWTAAASSAAAMAAVGGLIERLLLRRLAGQELAQVLVTLGLSFMIADL